MPLVARTPTAAQNESGTTIAAAVPTGTSTSDYVLAFHGCDYSATTGSAMTGAPGFSLLASFSTSSNLYWPVVKVWGKLAGSESGLYTFGQPTNTASVLSVCAFGGVSATAPVYATPLATDNTTKSLTTNLAPSVDGVSDGVVLCAWFADYYDASRGNSWAPPSGFTELTDISTSFTFMSLAYKPLTSNGATGSQNATPNRVPQDATRGVAMSLAPSAAATADFGAMLAFV